MKSKGKHPDCIEKPAGCKTACFQRDALKLLALVTMFLDPCGGRAAEVFPCSHHP